LTAVAPRSGSSDLAASGTDLNQRCSACSRFSIGGPLLALALVALIGVREAILLSVIPGLLAAAAMLYAVRHAPRLGRRERQPIRLRVRPVLRGRLGRLMLAVGAFEFGNLAATLLILRAPELVEPGRSTSSATQLALVLYTAYNLAATLTSLPAGRAGDRIGTTQVLATGTALFLASYLGLAAAGSSFVLLDACFVAAGIGIGFAETAEHAAVAHVAPEGLRGSAFGVLAAHGEARWPRILRTAGVAT